MTKRVPAFVLFLLLYLPALGSDIFALRHDRTVDLPSFHDAARRAFVERRSPYDPMAGAEAEKRLAQRVHPFLYPPPSLLVFAPLALVSYGTARVVVLVLNHALFLLLVHLLLRRLTGLERAGEGALAFFLAYVLLFQPVRATVAAGQVNLLVVTLIVLAWDSLRRGRGPAAAALPLSIAILAKTYPVLLLLPLAAHRRWRLVGLTLSFLAAALVFAAIVLPTAVWSDWMRDVLPSGGYGRTPPGLFSPAAPWNQSLNGFTARLFLENPFSAALAPSPAAARAVPALLACVLLGVAAAASLRAGARGDKDRFLDLDLSLWLVVTFAVAPLSWEHHLVLVLPACLLALCVALGPGVGGVTRALVVLAAFLLAWGPPLDSAAFKRGALTLLISGELYAVLLVGGFLLVWHRRARRDPALRAGFTEVRTG